MGTTSLYLNTVILESDSMSSKKYTYYSPLEDVVCILIDELPEIESGAVPILAEEIATGCLLFACTWLSTGGIAFWKYYSKDQCQLHIGKCLNELQNNSKELGGEDNTYWKTLSNRWHIPYQTWIKACSVFTYWIADTTLRYNGMLFNELANTDISRISFTPQQISNKAGKYRFTINVVIRDLLPTF